MALYCRSAWVNIQCMVYVCAMLINKLKCETMPEGEIFPYLLGGDFTTPNYKISRLDTSYSLSQIAGSNNFKNAHILL